jgi:hypothetical protein
MTWCYPVVRHAGKRAYLADAEQQLKAHFRQLDLGVASSWVPSLDSMGFAAGKHPCSTRIQ